MEQQIAQYRVRVGDLRKWEDNPRTLSDADYKRLLMQLYMGEHSPLLVTDEGIVLGGNMRLSAYQELAKLSLEEFHKHLVNAGMDVTQEQAKVRLEQINNPWVAVVRFVEDKGKWYGEVNGEMSLRSFATKEAAMLEYALSHNDNVGRYDELKLAELATHNPIEMSLYKIDLGAPQELSKIVAMHGPEPEQDEVEPVKEGEAVSRQGEIYQLGRHRLMCGDATVPADLEQLMAGHQADLLVTDPPYNVDYTGKTKEALKIENDVKSDTEFLEFLNQAFSTISKHIKRGSAFYIFHADSEGFNFRSAVKTAGMSLRQCLVWVKNSMVIGRQDYQWMHEPILYGWMQGEAHRWFGDRKQTTVLSFDRPTSSKDHPTMKPIALLSHLIRNSSKQDDIVLDPFAGSGSTLVACEHEERVAYLMELDPKYCDVIRKRYAKLVEAEDWQAATPVAGEGVS